LSAATILVISLYAELLLAPLHPLQVSFKRASA
jgi:hypothetical protein